MVTEEEACIWCKRVDFELDRICVQPSTVLNDDGSYRAVTPSQDVDFCEFIFIAVLTSSSGLVAGKVKSPCDVPEDHYCFSHLAFSV